MAALTIRNIEEPIKAELRMRSARNGRSMEEEARVILKSALKPQEGQKMHLAEEIRRRFAALGGFEMPDMPREFGRDPPDFSE